MDTVSEQLLNRNVGIMLFKAISDTKVDLLLVHRLTTNFDLELLGWLSLSLKI